MKRAWWCVLVWLGLCGGVMAADVELLEVRKIWDAGEHNAFTDLIRWQERWWCTFREAQDHVGGDGKVRVITSIDGEKWESAALIGEKDIDLRDPKMSVTPDNRLMIVAGGSVYRGTKQLQGRQPRVMFSKDGRSWTAPQKVLGENDWLWRVTWFKNRAYGVAYNTVTPANSGGKSPPGPEWTLKLYQSSDGVKWTLVSALEVPGRPNETTVRFRADGRMLAMVRREAGSKKGWLGEAAPPYTQWTWHEMSHQFGGPNFIELPDGALVAGTRDYSVPGKTTTLIGRMKPGVIEPLATLPSGGDNSYPGLVWHEGKLWVSYYASHEGKTSVYLAKIAMRLGVAHERYVSVDDACAWPNLTKLRDGTIVATIFNRPTHGQTEGGVDCWGTKDGRFWEKLATAVPHEPNTNRMNVAAGLSKGGDLLVLCSGWTNQKQPQRPKQADFRDDVLEPWVCRSSDGGRTWSYHKAFAPALPGWTQFIPFGDIWAGEDGALHTSCYAGEIVDPTKSMKTKGWRSWHFRSDDDGKTWRRVSVIGEKHNETSLFHLGGKRWLAAARIDAVELFRSDDDGVTWSGPVRVTGRNEINGHLNRLKDGRLVLTYGVRVAGRYGVEARLSADEGQTWGEPIVLVSDLRSGDCGYPSSVQRTDGSIVTAYYANGAPAHQRYHMGTVVWRAPVAASGGAAGK